MNLECRFCQSFTDDEIHVTEHWRIIVNINQSKLGNCLIVLKRHLEEIVELSDEEIVDLWEALRRTKLALSQAFMPVHINYSFNMNRIRHVHLHIYPRYYQQKRTIEELIFIDEETITTRRLPAAVHQAIVSILRDTFENR